MKNITRTYLGAYLQTVQYLGLPFSYKPYTTINEKLDIQAGVEVPEGEYPTMGYIGIGNGGHEMQPTASGVSIPSKIQHLATQPVLNNMLPFVMRTPDNDLTPVEREKYRGLRIEQHDGVTYHAYYLRKLDKSSTIPQVELRTVSDGQLITSTAYEPTVADLSPTPLTLDASGTLTTSGDYLSVTAKVLFSMTPEEVAEFVEVCRIIYGDEHYAIISEIALVSGYDKTITANMNGSIITYKEVIAAQANIFMNTFYACLFTNNGINSILDIGAVEPMLALTPSVTESSINAYVSG